MPTPKPVAHPIPEGMAGVRAMVEAARTPHYAALVTLCGMMGLRVGEALTIRPSHLKEDREPMIARFMGKGEKIREVPIHDRTYQFLLPRLMHCWRDDLLLCPVDDRAARRGITRLGERVLGHPVSSHDLRMTFGTTAYYTSHGDLRAVQELLGHASSSTTENYTHVSMDKMQDAADFWRDLDASSGVEA